MKKTPNQSIPIPPEVAGERLDVFLAEYLTITRSQAQKLITLEQVWVNGQLPQKMGQTVNTSDTIQISEKKVSTLASSLKKSKSSPEPDLYSQITIIAETPDYIVVDKPSGLLTHPTEANEPQSLAGFLLQKYPELKKVGEDEARPGIVHRLDKEASGLLVIARTQKMFNHLKQQFKDRTINKQYCALVHGRVAKDEGEIRFRLARSKNAERMAAMPVVDQGEDSTEGKEALTEFWVEKRFVNFTLLDVKIHTGRMHQIRAHFLAYNHPLVGDPLYFQKKRKRTWDEKLGRLFLHSIKLEFTDLDGEQQSFTSPLPPVLHHFLSLLT